jgi:ankyrin repeat protein
MIREDGELALTTAAELGDIEVVKLLLQKGIDVNAYDDEGKTAMNPQSTVNFFIASLWGQRRSQEDDLD